MYINETFNMCNRDLLLIDIRIRGDVLKRSDMRCVICT